MVLQVPLALKEDRNPTVFSITDGWTMNDLIYQWKAVNPVQMVANLSLPGGFKMDSFDNKNCDVKTATGKQYNILI